MWPHLKALKPQPLTLLATATPQAGRQLRSSPGPLHPRSGSAFPALHALFLTQLNQAAPWGPSRSLQPTPSSHHCGQHRHDSYTPQAPTASSTPVLRPWSQAFNEYFYFLTSENPERLITEVLEKQRNPHDPTLKRKAPPLEASLSFLGPHTIFPNTETVHFATCFSHVEL